MGHKPHRAARDEHVSAGRALTAARAAPVRTGAVLCGRCAGVMWMSGGRGGQRLVSSGSGSGWPGDGFVRGGERVAAIVPESFIDALRAAEDAEDAAEADAAMDEPGDPIPWEQVKAELDL